MTGRPPWALLPAVVALFVASGSVGGQAQAPVVEREGDVLCTAAEVHDLVRRFVRAFNRGELAKLDRVFAREPSFKWYSTPAPGERLRAAAYRRGSLMRYFDRRHATGERLKLLRLRVNSRAGDFEYRLVRRADDLEPTVYDGKGAVDCFARPRAIAVWSMGPA